MEHGAGSPISPGHGAEPPAAPGEGGVSSPVNITIGKKRILYGYNSDFTIDAGAHSFFIGRTGTGKSTVLESLFLRNIRMGYGGCFIDPHGQSADSITSKIPRNRTN